MHLFRTASKADVPGLCQHDGRSVAGGIFTAISGCCDRFLFSLLCSSKFQIKSNDKYNFKFEIFSLMACLQVLCVLCGLH
jgi:hypothetical protein